MENGLERFLTAQRDCYEDALKELRAGRKRSHWMWFIFPQIAGLGFSETARYYAIRDMEEARAYLRHPTLRARLVEISEALLSLESCDARAVMGWPDDLKLRSSMTLFALADPECTVFTQVLQKFFDGKPDEKTVELVKG